MKPKPFMSLISVMLPAPWVLKCSWISSLVTGHWKHSGQRESSIKVSESVHGQGEKEEPVQSQKPCAIANRSQKSPTGQWPGPASVSWSMPRSSNQPSHDNDGCTKVLRVSLLWQVQLVFLYPLLSKVRQVQECGSPSRGRLPRYRRVEETSADIFAKESVSKLVRAHGA